MILDAMARINKFRLPESIKRYSVKYVNLIQAPTYEEQFAKVAIGMRLAILRLAMNISLSRCIAGRRGVTLILGNYLFRKL